VIGREECETCGGEGVIWYDAADARGEHTTIEEPCPDCADGFDDRSPDERLGDIQPTWDDDQGSNDSQ
jgi:hypothetical protein